MNIKTLKKLLIDKKGQVMGKKIEIVVVLIITIVVLFQIFASLVPEAQSAGDEFSDATRCGDAGGVFNSSMTPTCNNNASQEGTPVTFDAIPIASIFSSTGVVILLLMVALFIGIIRIVMPSSRRK